MWRKVQTTGLVKCWYDEQFRITLRTIQAPAFIPVSDVSDGFMYIKSSSPTSFERILSYFESNYIGRVKSWKKCKPRFAVELLNLFDRVKENLPRTNNIVESWHASVKYDAKQNMTVGKVVELFHLDQSYMELNLLNIFQGKIKKRSS